MNLLGFVVSANVLLAPHVTAVSPDNSPRVRESLLQEAYLRLTTWYDNPSLLLPPMRRDGFMVQLSKEDVPCDAPYGSDMTPVTFGSFNISDVRPIDVFNTLTDVDHQLSWDISINHLHRLGEWQSEGVRGLAFTYPSGSSVIADREVFEWAAYSANFFAQEFWLVFSSLGATRLDAIRPRQGDAVPIENCLVAYRIREQSGGTLVTFTHHQNLNLPLMMSGRDAFQLSWGHVADWANALRSQSQLVAEQRRKSKDSVLPTWLLKGPQIKHRAPVRDPMTPFNLTAKNVRILLADEPRVKQVPRAGHEWRYVFLAVCGAFVYVVMVLRTYSCTRYLGQRKASSEKDCEQQEETSDLEESSSGTESSDDGAK
jgi:hypothetical protein